MRTKLRTIMAATACAVSLVALGGQAVAAADTAPATGQLTEDAQGVAPLRPSPAGCVGRTHNPHRSSHRPGTINVVGDTRCRVAVTRVGIHVKLYRSRWWGWEKRGDSGFRSRPGKSISANAGSPRCVGEKHDWLGTSYHESIEGGRKHIANTSNRQNGITC